MKSIKRTFTVIFSLLSLIFVSCVDQVLVGDDFLAKAPGTDVTLDTIFKNPEYTRRYLWNTYSSLYYGLNWDWTARGDKMNMGLMETLGDNFHSLLMWDSVNELYYPGKMNASVEGQHSKYSYSDGEGQWTGIRKAYIFLENIDRVPQMSREEKERLKAEAKCIIAFHYADMYRHFGGLPLVKKAYSFDDAVGNGNEMNIPRASAKETMQFIVDLIDEAYPALPWALPSEDTETWDGRITAAAALGVKIRILLFAASPLFNSNTPYYSGYTGKEAWLGSYDPSLWNEVVSACEEFELQLQNKGGYLLSENTSDRRAGFRNAYYKRGNGEILLATRIRDNSPGNYWDASYYWMQSIGDYGSLCPTLEYVDMYPKSNGEPFDPNFWSTYGTLDKDRDTVYIAGNPFADRDPRLYETVLVNGASFRSRTAEMFLGGQERGFATTGWSYASGFGPYKFVMDKLQCLGRQDVWPYIRLAEIYLSYAEALNESDGSMDKAISYVDKIRQRVGLNGLKESNPGKTWTKEALREEILRERCCEFGVEEVRFFDLIRWKREADFRKPLHGLKIIREMETCFDDGKQKERPTGRYAYIKYRLPKRAIQDSDDGASNFNPKWYLSAIPLKEINKSGLAQNPGW